MSSGGRGRDTVNGGTVLGAPYLWLRLEALAEIAGAAIAYPHTHQPWWLIPAAFLGPDLFALGYLRGPRVGSRSYNLVHATALPAILLVVAWTQHEGFLGALGLIWVIHIAFDRLLGFGLKYPDDFQHTHLSKATPKKVS